MNEWRGKEGRGEGIPANKTNAPAFGDLILFMTLVMHSGALVSSTWMFPRERKSGCCCCGGCPFSASFSSHACSDIFVLTFGFDLGTGGIISRRGGLKSCV